MELDIDIGADAKDWAAISANEKLKPVEAELRRVEEAITEVVSEMEYLRQREQMLRDTNESTNNRVKYFGIGTTWLLIGLWAWQIMYLRSYFRYVPGGGERKWAMTTNGLLGLSILSERGGWGMFGKRRLGVESQGFGANDIDGRLDRGSVVPVDYGRQIRQSFWVSVDGDCRLAHVVYRVEQTRRVISNLHRRNQFPPPNRMRRRSMFQYIHTQP